MSCFKSNEKKALHHILSVLLVALISCISIFGISSYDVQHHSVLKMIGYFGGVVGLPVALLVVCWKNQRFRWYLLIAIILILPLSICKYYYNIETEDHDLTNYLNGGTSFYDAAAEFLPTKDELQCADNIEYTHKSWKTGREYIYLAINYDASMYNLITEHMQQTYESNLRRYSGSPHYCTEYEPFLLNGHSYRCCDIVLDGEYYAIAYSLCEDNYAISIVFLSDSNLASMSVADILKSLNI